MTSPPAAAGPRRAALAFILVTVLLDMLAFGIVIPVLPRLILDFTGSAKGAAWWQAVFGTAFAAIQFFLAPVLGALSDRFGRRPVILISAAGLSLDYVLIALAPNLWWLLVGRVIAGFCSATISVPSAYIADVTPPDKRAAAFGMIGAAFGVGFILGPAVGGQAGAVDPRLPFWIAAALTGASFVYGLFVLPESLPPERRAAFEWRKANPAGALLLVGRYPQVWALIGLSLLSYLAHDSLPHTFFLYANTRFGWDTSMVGWAMVAIGVMSVGVQGAAIGPIVNALGEKRALFFGVGMGLLAFTLYGVAWHPALVFVAIVLGAFWGVWNAATQSLLSRAIDPSEQGRLQGALASLRALCQVLTPALFNGAFAAGVSAAGARLAGAPMLLSALLIALALPFAVAAARTPAAAPRS